MDQMDRDGAAMGMEPEEIAEVRRQVDAMIGDCGVTPMDLAFAEALNALGPIVRQMEAALRLVVPALERDGSLNPESEDHRALIVGREAIAAVDALHARLGRPGFKNEVTQ